MPLNSRDGYYQKEVFTIGGELISSEHYLDNNSDQNYLTNPKPLQAQKGNIYLLYKNIECGQSPFVYDKKAVLIDANPDEITIGYLNEQGFWGHHHDAGPLLKEVMSIPDGVEHKILNLSFMA